MAIGHAFGEDEPTAALVDLDDHELKLLTDQGGLGLLQVFRAGAHGQAQVRIGDKAAQVPEFCQQATAILFDDGGLDGLPGIEQLLRSQPVLPLQPLAVRHGNTILFTTVAQNDHRYAVADLQPLEVFVSDVLEVARCDDAVALGPEIDDDIVRTDLEDYGFAHLATSWPCIVVRAADQFRKILALGLALGLNSHSVLCPPCS